MEDWGFLEKQRIKGKDTWEVEEGEATAKDNKGTSKY